MQRDPPDHDGGSRPDHDDDREPDQDDNYYDDDDLEGYYNDEYPDKGGRGKCPSLIKKKRKIKTHVS